MSIYLYIKTHRITGLKYFGKTIRDPFKYKGSGKYWKLHLEKHGNLVDTEILGIFDNEEVCKEVAIKFSIDNNIVESSEWANLILEQLEGGDTSKTENYKTSLIRSKELLKKHKWWNNGITQHFCESPPDESYIRGRLKFNNVGAKIGAEVNKAKHWINNGSEEMMVLKIEPIPLGFKLGRCISNKTKGRKGKAKGKKWWNDGKIEIMAFIPPSDLFMPGRIIRSL